MYPTISLIPFSLLAFSTVTQATVVKWYTSRSCAGSAPQEFRVGCNICVDPTGDWFAADVTDIGANQRVSMHNQDKCTPASQVGQWFGPVCGTAGGTALRSVWVACDPERRLTDNSTVNANVSFTALD